MKLYIKLMILLVVLACTAPFMLKRSDGRPWMTVDDLKMPDISMPDFTLPSTSEAEIIDDTTVYKWLDQNGVLHYSDEAGTTSPSETMRLDLKSNTVHFDVQEEFVRGKSESGMVNNEMKSRDPQGSPYTQLPDLIDQAKNVESLLNQRQQLQEQRINGLGN